MCLDDEEEEAECEVEDDDQLFEFDMSPERDIVELDDVPVSPERHRAFSITSDSSGGSCSHRKVVAEPEVAGGFGNVFGSLSSGLGSDRRSVQVRFSFSYTIRFLLNQYYYVEFICVRMCGKFGRCLSRFRGSKKAQMYL